MGPNDADIIRVYTRESGGTSANDNTLDPSLNAEVVVDLEAGTAVIGTGAQWQVGIVIKDLVNGTTIPFTLTPTTVVHGNLGTPPWPAGTPAVTFTYTIPAGNLTLHKGSLCKVYAYLLIGINAANYDASFVESEPFLILPS
jgi:hypothetical protein